MISSHLVARLGGRSPWARLIVGSALVALVIALGMVGLARLIGVALDPVIPSAFAVVGAALFATRARRESNR